jgi:putative sterol carrier protein
MGANQEGAMAKASSEEGRQMLAALIDGRSDEQIVAGIQRRGPEKVLEQIFRGMCDAFIPEKADGESAVIGYEIRVGDDAFAYQLKIAGGKCKMVKGAPGPARTTLVAAIPDFLRVISGKQNPLLALVTGKLKLRGDLLFGRTMQRWFRQG